MAGIKRSGFLYFPTKDGKWLRDSQGKPRVYKNAKTAHKNLKTKEYDLIQVYAIDDVLSREEFEKGGGRLMTDNEIIKALGCCKIKTPPYKCEECPLLRGTSNSCISECKELAYDLINRQKAEIESKNRQIEELVSFQRFCERKAIKEFAKRLKRKTRKFTEYDDGGWDSTVCVVKVEDIDNLVKEITEETGT